MLKVFTYPGETLNISILAMDELGKPTVGAFRLSNQQLANYKVRDVFVLLSILSDTDLLTQPQ